MEDQNMPMNTAQPTQTVEPRDGGVGLLSRVSNGSTVQEVPKEKKDAIESAQNVILKMVYSKETMPDVLKMLKAGEPSQTIPNAANMIFRRLEKGTDVKIPNDIKLASAASLVMELMQIGNESNTFSVSDDAIKPILQNTFRMYITDGLKDGSIDPIELQKSVNPMMKGSAKGYGEEYANKTGMPMEPTPEMAMQKGTQDKLRPIQEENAKLKGLLQTQGSV